jgi:serine/threonine protein kinase
MCAGFPPFRAANTMAVLKRVCEETPRPIREVNPEVPTWLCDIIGRLHEKNPADRFASAREVADLLARCLAEYQQHGQVRPGWRSRWRVRRGPGSKPLNEEVSR